MSPDLNVLLDLDGTLTDPRDGIVRCLRHALDALGVPAPPAETLVQCIGPPLHESMADLLAETAGSARVAAAVAAYRERFAAVGLFENSVYDGIPAALAALVARGARLFVATSKPRVYAVQILEHFRLAPHFEAVFGAELDGRLADKSALVGHVLATAGLDPAGTLMVGDRRHDIAGALANGVVPVGVLWGYGSCEELVAAGAERLLAVPAELAALDR